MHTCTQDRAAQAPEYHSYITVHCTAHQHSAPQNENNEYSAILHFILCITHRLVHHLCAYKYEVSGRERKSKSF